MWIGLLLFFCYWLLFFAIGCFDQALFPSICRLFYTCFGVESVLCMRNRVCLNGATGGKTATAM